MQDRGNGKQQHAHERQRAPGSTSAGRGLPQLRLGPQSALKGRHTPISRRSGAASAWVDFHRTHAGAHGRRAPVESAAQSESYFNAPGAMSGNQAVQQVQAGLKAIHVSGWQVAANANGAGHDVSRPKSASCRRRSHSLPGASTTH